MGVQHPQESSPQATGGVTSSPQRGMEAISALQMQSEFLSNKGAVESPLLITTCGIVDRAVYVYGNTALVMGRTTSESIKNTCC